MLVYLGDMFYSKWSRTLWSYLTVVRDAFGTLSVKRDHSPEKTQWHWLLLYLRVGAGGGGSRSTGHGKKDIPSPPASHSGLRQCSESWLSFLLSKLFPWFNDSLVLASAAVVAGYKSSFLRTNLFINLLFSRLRLVPSSCHLSQFSKLTTALI